MVSIPWRTGVNMREFAFYDRREWLRYSPATLPSRDTQVVALQRLNVPLVRFYAVHRNASLEDNLAQVGKTLDLLHGCGMQAVVCVGDSIWESGHTIPGNDEYHRDTPMLHLQKRYWHERGYEKYYLPYLRRLVERFAKHPAVGLWELGNEFAIHPQPSYEADFNSFVQFVDTASRAIKAIAPRSLVTTGLINTNQVVPAGDDAQRYGYARRLYSLPGVDAISLHVYAEDPEDHLAMIDVKVARDLGKPFFVGELGADVTRDGGRVGYLRDEMARWKDRGAFSVMVWGFDDSPDDRGICDTKGFGRIHPDYAELEGLMLSFSASSVMPIVAPDTAPIKPIDPPPSARFSLIYPMRWAYRVEARFNEPANYSASPTKVQRREGMMFVPLAPDQPLEVLAAAAGKVTQIDRFDAGYGNFVVIEHSWNNDTYATWYGHLDSVRVVKGQQVKAGDVIGMAGKSGNTNRVVLFFSLQHIGKGLRNYVVDDVIDPLPFLPTAEDARNEADYEADVTIPDHTVMKPGEMFKKIWRIRNDGNVAWGEGYRLVYYGGAVLGMVSSVPLPSAAPGASVSVGVEMVAPGTPGVYRSTWKPQAPNGDYFPHEMFVIIDVRDTTAMPHLGFVRDVTIPDGTVVKPGEPFTKTWRVRNDGSVAWTAGYTLRFVGGDRMGAADGQPLPALQPGQEGEISLNLIAPTVGGLHRSTWQGSDPQGKLFDYDLFAEINVQREGEVNTAGRFSAPIRAGYRKGLAFGDPVSYLADGKHKGVDYLTSRNPEIYAGGRGVVYAVLPCSACRGTSMQLLGLTPEQQSKAINDINMGFNYGFGNLIIVRHDWNDLPEGARRAMAERNFHNHFAFVYYAHLTDNFKVKAGDPVEAGTLLGFVGNTGNSWGEHLHLEIRCLPGSTALAFAGSKAQIDPEAMFVF